MQKSATVSKEIRERQSNTFARSNVLGNPEVDANQVNIHGASNVNRNEKHWGSSVFAGPKSEQSKRTRLNHNDKGREGLFGDTMERDAYQKKTNLAAAISTKEATRPPNFDNSMADERKNRELYGNSAYDPVVRDNKRQFKPAHVGMDAQLNRDTKNQKASMLSSNVLSNDDPELVAERSKWNSNAEKLVSQASGWSSQNNMKRTTNQGGVDAYRQR